MKNQIKIALSGGGTAGHIWPTLDVANQIKKIEPEAQFIYLGSRGEIEKNIIPQKQIKLYQIFSGKLRRYWSWENFIDPIKVIIGFFQSLIILAKNRPQVVFAKGGYVTVPVVIAARLLKIPTIAHESDSILGLANRILFRLVQKIMISFPSYNYGKKYQKKLFYSGLPTREEFFQTNDKSEGYKTFKISDRIPVLLITGGSQGSHIINKNISKIASSILEKYQIIHSTGSLDYSKIKKRKHHLKEDKAERYKIYRFLPNLMPEALKIADLVVSRAGANTLAEISALSRPSIIIPLATAASNHQYYNARVYAEYKAAIVIEEKDLTPKKLQKTILDLLNRKVLLEQLGKNAHKLAKPNAAKIIAEHVLSLI